MDFGYNRYPLFLSYSNFPRVSVWLDTRVTIHCLKISSTISNGPLYSVRYTFYDDTLCIYIYTYIHIYFFYTYYKRTYLKACVSVGVYTFMYDRNNKKVLRRYTDKLVFHLPPRKHYLRAYSYL
jgi:hypothetical protein